MNKSYIRAHRSKSLEKSILVLAYIVIEELKPERKMKLITLYNCVKVKLKTAEQKDFMLALNFLFALGKIEYNPKADAIEVI